MKKQLIIFIAAVFTFGVLHAQKTSKTNFDKIGAATVDFQSANGVVSISASGAFKAIRVQTDAPVHIDNLIVVYQDGAPETIPVRYDFKAGVQSRDINLQGSQRNIKEVDFVYKHVVKDNSAKATVEIWGSK